MVTEIEDKSKEEISEEVMSAIVKMFTLKKELIEASLENARKEETDLRVGIINGNVKCGEENVSQKRVEITSLIAQLESQLEPFVNAFAEMEAGTFGICPCCKEQILYDNMAKELIVFGVDIPGPFSRCKSSRKIKPTIRLAGPPSHMSKSFNQNPTYMAKKIRPR